MMMETEQENRPKEDGVEVRQDVTMATPPEEPDLVFTCSLSGESSLEWSPDSSPVFASSPPKAGLLSPQATSPPSPSPMEVFVSTQQDGGLTSSPKNGLASPQERVFLSPSKTVLPSPQATSTPSPIKIVALASTQEEDSPQSPIKMLALASTQEEGCPQSPSKAELASSEELSLGSPLRTDFDFEFEPSEESRLPSPRRITGFASPETSRLPSPPETAVVEFPVTKATIPLASSQENQHDGSGETQTIPVTDRQETEIPKEIFVVPEPKDFRRHQEGCSFYLWNEVHRKSLLKMDAVKERIFNTTCTIKGKTYGWEHQDEIKQNIEENVAIRKYLVGSRNAYESYRLKMMSLCKCSQTDNNQLNSNPVTANLSPAVDIKQDEPVLNGNSETVLYSDLRLSESEEDMDTN